MGSIFSSTYNGLPKWLQKILAGVFKDLGVDNPYKGSLGDTPITTLPGFGNAMKSSSGFNLLEALTSYLKSISGEGMTNADRERMDYQGEWNNRLAEADQQRKEEFYEKYESYGAQVRQMQDAGLNPALMMQGGASVSATGGATASGVSAPSSGVGDILGAVLQLSLKSAQMKQDKELRLQQLAIEADKNKSYTRYLDAVAAGQEISNEYRAAQESAKLENIEANTATLRDQLKNNEVSRRLMESGITQNQADAALKVREAALKEIEAKHRDEYLRLQNEYQELLNEAQRTTNPYIERHLMAQIRELNKRADLMVEQATMVVLERDGQAITNGLLAKEFNTWDKTYKRNAAQSWIKAGASAVGAVAGTVGAGAAVSKAIGAGASVVNNISSGLVAPPPNMVVGPNGLVRAY